MRNKKYLNAAIGLIALVALMMVALADNARRLKLSGDLLGGLPALQYASRDAYPVIG
jgi:hypothetical protein